MNYVVLDVETANSDYSSICQIGLVVIRDSKIAAEKSILVDPEMHFDAMNTNIHGISSRHVVGKDTFPAAFYSLAEKLKPFPILHHSHFDHTAINRAYDRYNATAPALRWLDSTKIVRRAWPQFAQKGYGLSNMCKHLDIKIKHHDALEDARATHLVLANAFDRTETTVEDWFERSKTNLTTNAPARATQVQLSEKIGGIVFTGTLSKPRGELQNCALEEGYTTPKTVTQATVYLVVGQDQAGEELPITSKVKRALELQENGSDIQIISEGEFWVLMNQNSNIG